MHQEREFANTIEDTAQLIINSISVSCPTMDIDRVTEYYNKVNDVLSDLNMAEAIMVVGILLIAAAKNLQGVVDGTATRKQ